MSKSKENPALVLKASVWLCDEERFTLLEDPGHTLRLGEEFVIEGELWQVVTWTDRIECEWVVN